MLKRTLRFKLSIVALVILTTLVSANALRFLPKNYATILYVPDLPKAYDAFKATPIGQTLLSDTGIGFESLVTGIIEQQLLSMKYTKDDFDLFQKEMMFAVDVDGKVTLALGPVKNPTRMRKILEGFLEADTLKNVKFVDNYFVYSELSQVGGGKAPSNLTNMLQGNLAVMYSNINDGKAQYEGYGYVKIENNGLVVYQKLDPKNAEAKNQVKQLQATKPIDIFSDKNVGGDFLMFVNRPMPDALRKSLIQPFQNALNLQGATITGVMYMCADIGSALAQMLNQDSQSQANISISSYGVVFGTNLKMPAEVKKYVTIANERYGVITSENGMETYILIKPDRMITYTVAPNKYKPGDRTFFTSVYDPKYIAGVFINLEPLINSLLGKKVKSSATIVTFIDGESIITRGVVK
ncbi:hypothetical protein [Fervidobacterium thailandense]|uniref:Uncharacterized protein n=1 Tax=Fervidobacterium thailandense TaxID=1008305 RepID=A0A1E3G203_9BACT|nr:hypothetical protein [Fervidobacterium thailandense]ODN30296.1 hypothetical protein A4H02_06320 [Fervidobacterium thailandense]